LLLQFCRSCIPAVGSEIEIVDKVFCALVVTGTTSPAPPSSKPTIISEPFVAEVRAMPFRTADPSLSFREQRRVLPTAPMFFKELSFASRIGGSLFEGQLA
jgi:hypothetical protein